MAKFDIKEIFNDKSRSEKTATDGAFVIRHIPIAKLVPSEKNAYGIREIEELAANIEEIGLQQNLVVEGPNDSGFYTILSGERRFQACLQLFHGGDVRFETLPCKVDQPVESALSELKLIYGNALTRELTDFEKMHQASRVKELLLELRESGHPFKGRMRDIVAEMLDTSPAQVGRYETIAKHLVPERMAEFERGDIGVSHAHMLAGLPPEVQADRPQKTTRAGRTKPERTAEKSSAVYPIDRKETIRVLSEIAEALETGQTTDYDIASACRDAALLLGGRRTR